MGADGLSGDSRSSHGPGGMPCLVAAVSMACTKWNTVSNFRVDSKLGWYAWLAFAEVT